MFKKIKLLSLAVAMTFGLANVGYSQQEVISTLTGVSGETNKGSAANPYQIATPADLQALSTYVRTAAANHCDSTYFRVTQDINMSGVANFIPIGGRDAAGTAASTTNYFSGVFDGNNKVISNLTITGSLNYTGLFGLCDTVQNVTTKATFGAAIRGLGLQNVNISGGQYVGALIGSQKQSIDLDSCYVTGGSIIGTSYVGGIIGYAYWCIGQPVYYCYSTNLTISGTTYVGGILGYSDYIYFYNCYSTLCSVSGTSYVGGFGGYTTNTSCYGSYAANTVNRTSGTSIYFGGFVATSGGSSWCPRLSYYSSTWKGTDGSGANWSDITSEKKSLLGLVVDDSEMKTNCFVLRLLKYGNQPVSGTSSHWQMAQSSSVNGGYPVLRLALTSSNGVDATADPDCFPILGKANVKGDYQLSTLHTADFPNTVGTTRANPYIIATAHDLEVLSEFVKNDFSPSSSYNNTYGKYFKISNDIDMNSIASFQSIGGRYKDTCSEVHTFYGAVDGNNKTISNLHINTPLSYTGLFGYAETFDSITNLILLNPNVVSTKNYVGSFSGYNGRFANCYVKGANISGTNYVGGFIGSYGSIYNSYTYGGNVSGSSYVGGATGSAGSIYYSYFLSTVNRLSGSSQYFGGLCGDNNVSVYNSYYLNAWRGTDNGTSGGSNWTDVEGKEAGDPMIAPDMKTNCFVLYLLGTNGVTTGRWQRAISGENDDYPVLRWEGRGENAIEEPVRGQCFPVLGFGSYRLSTSPADENFDANIGTTVDNPYLIATVADLQTLSRFVKDDYHVVQYGNTYNKYFKVENNIDMSSVPNFLPIGGRNRSGKLGYPNNAFRGKFEGNNKEISNININSTAQYTGFFGYTNNESVVKNLGLDHVNIIANNTPTWGYTGCFAGYLLDGRNCYVLNSSVTSNTGMVAGFAYSATARDCYVDNVTVVNTSSYTSGFNYTGTATNCYVANSSITGSGSYTGGFTSSSNTCTGCYVYKSTITGTSYVGGFQASSSSGQLRNCYTTACKVSGTNYVGGFLSTTNGATNNLYNSYSCDTVYRVSGSSSTTFGGFRGYIEGATSTPSNCFFFDQWNGSSVTPVTAGGTQQTAAQMKAAGFIATLNSGASPANPFTQDVNNVNYGYPVLKWQGIKVQNLAADPVAPTSATLNARITNGGSLPSNNYKFRYKLGTGAWQYIAAVENTAPTADPNTFKADIASLTFNRIYYFQVYAVIGAAAGDTIFAPDTLAFYTKDFIVEATPATNVDYSHANINGFITCWSGAPDISNIYFKYWKATSGEGTAVQSPNLSVVHGDKTFMLENLLHSTQYNYRIYMVRPDTTVASSIQSLWTKTFDIRTLAPAASLNDATLNGQVDYTGSAPTAISFEWWPGTAGVLTGHTPISITSYTSGNKSTDISGLTPYSDYSYRINVTIDGNVVQGSIITFNTKLFSYPETIIASGKTIELTDAIMADNSVVPGGVLPRFIIRDGGSLLNNTTSPIASINDATVERTLLNENYAFVGTPRGTITAGTYFDIVGNPPAYQNVSNGSEVSMLKFVYETNLWFNDNGYILMGKNTNMVPGNGYLAYVLDPGYPTLLSPAGTAVTLAMRGGTLYNANTSVTYTNNGSLHTLYSMVDGRWYALANPYPANLWTKPFINTNAANLETRYLYVFADNQSWNPLDEDIDNKVKQGEGFFVSGKNGATTFSHTFQFNKAHQTKATAKSSTNTSKITITSTANNESINANISINELASNGFDPYDAYKMLGMNDYLCEPYFIVDSSMIAINSISVLPYECPMNISSKATNNVTLSFGNIPEDIEVTLIDGEQEIAISNGDTYPTIVSEGQNAERFRIRLNKLSNGLANVTTNGISLWVANDAL
ncbi:MAG: hypothetical protein LBO06_04440, partial [Bacteroidales bacterium]|nr:hypothetical protein [Bacteroidales bacterium]